MTMTNNNSEEVYAFLGPCGAMLSGSKSAYRNANPKNLVLFNANVCTVEDVKEPRFFGLFTKKSVKVEKVWWGDFDLSASRDSLKNLASAINKTVVLLAEMDARFDNEAAPLYENFVYKVTPSGDESFGEFYSDYIRITDEVIEVIQLKDICDCEICDCKPTVEDTGIDAVEVVTKILQEEVAKEIETKAKRAPKAKAVVKETPTEKPLKKPRAKKAPASESAVEKPAAKKATSKPRTKKVVNTTKTLDNPGI